MADSSNKIAGSDVNELAKGLFSERAVAAETGSGDDNSGNAGDMLAMGKSKSSKGFSHDVDMSSMNNAQGAPRIGTVLPHALKAASEYFVRKPPILTLSPLSTKRTLNVLIIVKGDTNRKNISAFLNENDFCKDPILADYGANGLHIISSPPPTENESPRAQSLLRRIADRSDIPLTTVPIDVVIMGYRMCLLREGLSITRQIRQEGFRGVILGLLPPTDVVGVESEISALFSNSGADAVISKVLDAEVFRQVLKYYDNKEAKRLKKQGAVDPLKLAIAQATASGADRNRNAVNKDSSNFDLEFSHLRVAMSDASSVAAVNGGVLESSSLGVSSLSNWVISSSGGGYSSTTNDSMVPLTRSQLQAHRQGGYQGTSSERNSASASGAGQQSLATVLEDSIAAGGDVIMSRVVNDDEFPMSVNGSRISSDEDKAIQAIEDKARIMNNMSGSDPRPLDERCDEKTFAIKFKQTIKSGKSGSGSAKPKLSNFLEAGNANSTEEDGLISGGNANTYSKGGGQDQLLSSKQTSSEGRRTPRFGLSNMFQRIFRSLSVPSFSRKKNGVVPLQSDSSESLGSR